MGDQLRGHLAKAPAQPVSACCRDTNSAMQTCAGRNLNQGHPGYLALLDEMKALHLRKVADYGTGADPLQNLRNSADFGIPPWVGAVLRMNDKVQRIKAFCVNGKLENEGIEDNLMDLAAYSLLALVLLREEKGCEGKAKD